MSEIRCSVILKQVSHDYPKQQYLEDDVFRDGMASYPSPWTLAWLRFCYTCQSSKAKLNPADQELELIINLMGAKALHYAVLQGETRAGQDAVKTLLERNASVDAVNFDGRTPLMLAVLMNHVRSRCCGCGEELIARCWL